MIMNNLFAKWPLPGHQRSLEQNEQWWQECFVRTQVIDSFLGMTHAAAIVGHPGTGKTTALELLAREERGRALLLNYPLNRWPCGKTPLKPGEGHISQIMSAAAIQIHDLISQQPDLYVQLNSMQQEFLLWLIGDGLGLRTLQRFILMLNNKTKQSITIARRLPILYPGEPTALDIHSQISELVEMINVWQMEKIFLLIDIRELELSRFSNEIQAFLHWSDLLEQPDFIIRLALPLSAITKHHIIKRDNGRINIIDCEYTDDEIIVILHRIFQTLTNNPQTRLQEFITPDLTLPIREEIIQLYGTSAVAGWLNWLEILLFESTRPTPIEADSRLELLRYHYYQHHVRLAFDPYQQGVWRGPQFLSLEKQPYEFLKKLFELRGQSSPDELYELAGSQANLNTLTSRIRKQIEPLGSKKEIYLHNRRDLGYWLENFTIEDQ